MFVPKELLYLITRDLNFKLRKHCIDSSRRNNVTCWTLMKIYT